MKTCELAGALARINRSYAGALVAQHRAICAGDATAYADARTTIADLDVAWALLLGADPAELGRDSELTEQEIAA